MRIVLGIAAAGLAASGATTGLAQDNAAGGDRRSYDLAGFDEISMVGPHHVIVSVGDRFSVSAEGPRETLEHTDVVVEGDRLKIQPKGDDPWWERRREGDHWPDYQAATYRVTLPRLAAASLAGSGDIRVDRVDGEAFSGSVAGSGLLDVAALEVDSARFSIAGSGNLEARGTARESRVSIAGSGELRARDVSSETASVSIAGSGDAALTVASEARVSIVGSGDVDIAGPAHCSVSRLGSGRVTCNGVERSDWTG